MKKRAALIRVEILLYVALFTVACCNSNPTSTNNHGEHISWQWQADLSMDPLPKDAKKLAFQYSFLNEGVPNILDFVSHPRYLHFNDSKGTILVSDIKGNSVYQFDAKGTLLKKIGRGGQGPGEFSYPSTQGTGPLDQIVIFDRGNRRIQIFDAMGNFMSSFRLFRTYSSMAVSRSGKIFLAVFSPTSDNHLVEVFSMAGRFLYKFGSRIISGTKTELKNDAHLCMRGSELYVAWRFAPIVRKYSEAGQLLYEHHLSTAMLDTLDQRNKISNSNKDQEPPWQIIVDIHAGREGYYVLLNYPRLEMLKVDGLGKVQGTFWADVPIEHYITAFALDESDRTSKVFLLEEFPDIAIRVYSLCDKAEK